MGKVENASAGLRMKLKLIYIHTYNGLLREAGSCASTYAKPRYTWSVNLLPRHDV